MFLSVRSTVLAVTACVLLTPLLAGQGDPTKKPTKPKNYLGVRSASTPMGVEVMEVLRGSPAEKAGLLPRDLIMKIDGYEIGFLGGLDYPLQSEIRRSPGESKFLIKRARSGKIEELSINLVVEEKKPEVKPDPKKPLVPDPKDKKPASTPLPQVDPSALPRDTVSPRLEETRLEGRRE